MRIKRVPQDFRVEEEIVLPGGERGAYAYSLEELPVSKAPLEAFLFVTKRGNCDFCASATRERWLFQVGEILPLA